MSEIQQNFKLLVISIFWLIVLPSSASDSNARYTLEETYGLHTEPESTGYRVKTFIPSTFLLFNITKEEVPESLKDDYIAATTQDGVRVFLLERTISDSSFSDRYGRQDVIFNKSYEVCSVLQCNSLNDDELLDINAGEVFEKKERNYEDSVFYELKGNRGDSESPNYIKGYISKSELDDLNLKAGITHASLKHPRYAIEKLQTSNEVNTSCGEEINVGKERTLDNILPGDKIIFNAFDLAKIGNNNVISFKKSYGDAGKEVVFRLYKVVDQRGAVNKIAKYAVQVQYRCTEGIINKRTFIESSAIVNTENNRQELLLPYGTPHNLLEFTKAPYMYSVNNSRQYFLLMNKLSNHFESRALAGFFLAMFNRSCNGTIRKSETGCQHKAYEE